MTLLEATSLTKSFGSLCLISDLSLSIHPGESIAICGRSGSGKTTLLHLLGTLESPDSGSISIAQEQITPKNAPRIRLAHIGFIFQAFNLLEDFSVLDNVLMPSRIARRPLDYTHALSLLEEVDLLSRKNIKASLLSGGERQRVAIARALCNNPSLILADEPTGNLDAENAQRIGKLLVHCARTKQKSLILVTHDPDLARLCDQIFFLKDGQLHPAS